MADDGVSEQNIHWLQLLPWIRLTRGIGLALDARKLILAALGLVLMALGWGALERGFPHSTLSTPAVLTANPFTEVSHAREQPLLMLAMTVAYPLRIPVGPFWTVFSLGGGTLQFLHALLAGLWAVVVWSLVGGAIARIAVVQAATGKRIGLLAAARFAMRKASTLIIAPIMVLVAVFFLAGTCALIGLLYQIPGGQVGVTVGGVLAFLPLLLGLLMAWLLIGLGVGWPLMIASVAAENEDSFDALSRSYSYVFQRPTLYAGLALVAWLVGMVGVVFVGLLAHLVIQLAAWGLAFGAPDSLIRDYLVDPRANTTAGSIHAGWVAIVFLLAYAWVFSYFWTAAAQIYLLLRHNVDGTDWDHVDLPDRPSGTPPPDPAEAPLKKPAASGEELDSPA